MDKAAELEARSQTVEASSEETNKLVGGGG